MVNPVKAPKKGTRGEAAAYLSRRVALKKLQISGNEFRRLCILKGIYPREPKNRVKAQKGRPGIDVLYLKKDIKFLAHEPMIWKFRDRKIHQRRLKKAKNRLDKDKERSVKKDKPTLVLDHMVRERYPTFNDALSDLDDPLSLCFLFARINKSMYANQSLVQTCRKLTTEFQHYVITARCLKKVFISVKGYYYQAEIMGQTVTWSVPHPLALVKPYGINFKIMRIFSEFYVVMLGFINYRLFQSINLKYPPRITRRRGDKDFKELLASLNRPLAKAKGMGEDDDEEDQEEDFDLRSMNKGAKSVYNANMERQMDKKQKKLFEGLKFFLGRENNIESLTFVIRAVGGEVSYEETTCAGATYQEDDQTITHQIVDRPKIATKHMSRYYIQPQWVYDSINARNLLPVQDYFPGESLPAHVSPFDTGEDEYIPPEKQRLLALRSGKPIEDPKQKKSLLDQEAELNKFNDVADDNMAIDAFENYETIDRVREFDDDYDDLEDDVMDTKNEDTQQQEQEKVSKKRVKTMSVKVGSHHEKDVDMKQEQVSKTSLRKMFLSGNKKRLYSKLKREEHKQETRREKMAYSRMHLEKAIAKKDGPSRERKEQRVLSDLSRNKRKGKPLY